MMEEDTMMFHRIFVRQLLFGAPLSAAMASISVPAALADPPGYLFQNFERTAPTVADAPAPAPQRSATSEAPAFRKRLACTALGIDPGSAAFGRCVADMDQPMRNAQALDR